MDAAESLRLFLSGFIEYFSATSMYAAWQAGLQPISPYIEAQMPDGSWKRVVDEMGFPAGLPRTITVDLTGKLPPGAQKIRITSNLQIYWDQVLVDNGPAREDDVRTTELPLASATLGFRGYPRQVDGETPGDLTYYYEQVSTTGPVLALPRKLHTVRRRDAAADIHRQSICDLRHGRRHRRRVRHGRVASAARRMEARLLLLRQRFREGHGLLRGDSLHRRRHAVPWHEHLSVPCERSTIPTMRAANTTGFDWNDRFESGASNARGYRFVYDTADDRSGAVDSAQGVARAAQTTSATGGCERTTMKKLALLSIAALTLSAIYLYAWPAPNLFYAGGGAVSRWTGRAVLPRRSAAVAHGHASAADR